MKSQLDGKKVISVRPYVSLDVETTGLYPEEGHHLLSVGMVFDSGLKETPIEELPKIHLLIMPPYTGDNRVPERERVVGSEFALNMNKELVHLIENEKQKPPKGMVRAEEAQAMSEIIEFIGWANEKVAKWDKDNGHKPEPVQILAKNGQKLDIPMMDSHFKMRGLTADGRWFSKMISHRVMDLGSMYVEEFGKVVSLSEINKLTGRDPVSHNAVEDAIDNIEGLRLKFFGK